MHQPPVPRMGGPAVVRRPRRLVQLVTVGAFLATAFAGCSGADPAEVKAIAEQYKGSENPLAVPVSEEQAQCRAKVYLESDLSDGALDDIRKGKQPAPRTKEDVALLTELAGKLAECL